MKRNLIICLCFCFLLMFSAAAMAVPTLLPSEREIMAFMATNSSLEAKVEFFSFLDFTSENEPRLLSDKSADQTLKREVFAARWKQRQRPLKDGKAAVWTIYDLRTAPPPQGTVVEVTGTVNLYVSAGQDKMFFIQAGNTEFQAICVFVSDKMPIALIPGDVVKVVAQYALYYGKDELLIPTGMWGQYSVTVLRHEAAPTAKLLTPEEILANGPKWESMLVKIINSKAVVLCDEYDEWGLGTTAPGVVVDDFFADYCPYDGQEFSAVSGPLDYGYGKHRILPRSFEEDIAWAATPLICLTFVGTEMQEEVYVFEPMDYGDGLVIFTGIAYSVVYDSYIPMLFGWLGGPWALFLDFNSQGWPPDCTVGNYAFGQGSGLHGSMTTYDECVPMVEAVTVGFCQ